MIDMFLILNCMLNCMIKPFYSNYPSCLCLSSYVVFLFAMITKFLGVSRYGNSWVIAVTTRMLQLSWVWIDVGLIVEPTFGEFYYFVILAYEQAFGHLLNLFNSAHGILVCLVFSSNVFVDNCNGWYLYSMVLLFMLYYMWCFLIILHVRILKINCKTFRQKLILNKIDITSLII